MGLLHMVSCNSPVFIVYEVYIYSVLQNSFR